jgi:hypothetical protein
MEAVVTIFSQWIASRRLFVYIHEVLAVVIHFLYG